MVRILVLVTFSHKVSQESVLERILFFIAVNHLHYSVDGSILLLADYTTLFLSKSDFALAKTVVGSTKTLALAQR